MLVIISIGNDLISIRSMYVWCLDVCLKRKENKIGQFFELIPNELRNIATSYFILIERH